MILICVQLHDCVMDLTGMQHQSGPHLEDFFRKVDDGTLAPNMAGGRNRPPQDEQFTTIRAQFLRQLLENLESRFPNVQLIEAMQVSIICFVYLLQKIFKTHSIFENIVDPFHYKDNDCLH